MVGLFLFWFVTMRVTLELDLNDEFQDARFKMMMASSDMQAALWEIAQYLRGIVKRESGLVDGDAYDQADAIYERVSEIIGEYNIELY